MGKIYITCGIRAYRKTEEDIKCEYNIHKARNPRKEVISFDSFLEMQKDLQSNIFGFDLEDVGYYSDARKARTAIRQNSGDIYRNGKYPYAALIEVSDDSPFGRINVGDDAVLIYKWDGDSGYNPMEKSESEYKKDNFGNLMSLAVRGRQNTCYTA